MKNLIAVACLLVFGCLTSYAQSGIAGEWKGTRETPNGTFEINYTFKVEGTALTGVWKTQFGERTIENGTVEADGKKFAYTVSFNEMTIKNSGELVSENEIVIKSDRGEMKLTRVQK